VSSAALIAWQGERKDRIDDLFDLHARVGGTGPGRRRRLEELNHAVILKLAAEFQGFARDLHQVASEKVAAQLSGQNADVERVLLRSLTLNRKLDGANANAGNLGEDFRRLGVTLWASLKEDRSGAVRPKAFVAHMRLEALNMLRNAIVHSNATVDLQHAIGLLEGLWRSGGGAKVASARIYVRKNEVQAIRVSLDYLAKEMDRLVAEQIAVLLVVEVPWYP
jgi:hypothetical protein